MKKFLISVCIFTFLTLPTVYADIASYNITEEEGTYVVSGALTEALATTNVAIEVLNKGKAFDTLYTFEDVFYIEQTDVEAGEKTFSFTFKMPTSSGTYKARLKGKGFSKSEDFDINYVSPGDFETALTGLKGNMATYEVFDAFLETDDNAFCLGITTVPAGVLESNARSNMYNFLKGEIDNITDAQYTKGMWKDAILTELLTNSSMTDVADYEEYLNLNDSNVSKWYSHIKEQNDGSKYFTKAMKTAVNSVSGSEISYKALEKSKKGALVLSVVAYPDGFKNIGYAIKDFSDITGIKTSDENEKYKAVAGEQYDNFDTFIKMFKELNVQTPGGGSNSPGGGAGGGGGNGGFVSGAVKEETKEPVVVGMTFIDLDTVPWAYEAIATLSDLGIINGKSEERFDPDSVITREEFTKLCVELVGSDKEKYNNNFADVPAGEWYTSYVNIAYQKGICKGISDDSFGVGLPVSRQDMTVILYNTLKLTGFAGDTTDAGFADSNLFGDYAKDAISALFNCGAVNGVGNNRFNPLGNATRAEAAKMIFGVLDYIR